MELRPSRYLEQPLVGHSSPMRGYERRSESSRIPADLPEIQQFEAPRVHEEQATSIAGVVLCPSARRLAGLLDYQAVRCMRACVNISPLRAAAGTGT